MKKVTALAMAAVVAASALTGCGSSSTAETTAAAAETTTAAADSTEAAKEDGKTGIGLGNIYRRIHAMYQDGNVEVYSRKDAGTVIKIQIRHKEVGEEDVPCVGGGR